ncbi:hypothetical protein ACOME3_004443 [Neoechinorhynchus agilis]
MRLLTLTPVISTRAFSKKSSQLSTMLLTRFFLSSLLITYLLLSALVNGDEVEHQCAQFGANKGYEIFIYCGKGIIGSPLIDLIIRVREKPEANSIIVEGAHLNEIPIDLAFIIPHNDAFFYMPGKQSNGLSTLTRSSMRRFKHLKKLRIQGGLIKKIKDNAFLGFRNLEELNLMENAIYRLGVRMNAHLPQLHTLILSNNRLKDDSFEIIAKMTNLKTLDVSNNLIENAKFGDGSSLAKLEEVSVYGNPLKSFYIKPANMRSLEFSNSGDLADFFKQNCSFLKLSKLIVHGGTTSFINSRMLKMAPNIQNFGILDANLQSVPKGNSFTRANMVSLNFKGNRISALRSNDLYHWQSLRKLDLSYNDIEVIDEEALWNLKELTSLNLNGNRISDLPLNLFKNNVNLKVLSLAKNNLESFNPELIEDIPQVAYMSIAKNNVCELVINKNDTNRVGYVAISDNSISIVTYDKIRTTRAKMDMAQRIDEIPKSIATTLNLTVQPSENMTFFVLNASSLGLKAIKDIHNFDGYTVIKSIDMSHNEISRIYPYDFLGLEDLKFLSLQFNQIETILRGTFARLRKLIALDLSHNKLTDIDNEDSFRGLNNLIILSLSNNVLNSIPSKALSELKSLTLLDLSNNPIAHLFNAPFLKMKSIGQINVNGTSLEIVFDF